jgi:Tol biopolymer transport system component
VGDTSGRSQPLLAILLLISTFGSGCGSTEPSEVGPARLLITAYLPEVFVARLYAVNQDGSHVVDLGYGNCGRWSPQAERIAFARSPGGSEPTELYVMGADGRSPRPVPGFVDVGCPAWSPDGERIVFLHRGVPNADPPQEPRLFTVRSDGSDPRDLLVPGDDPAWSPDGEWIAYVNGGLFVIRPDGSDRRALTSTDPNGFPFHADPEWTPDSRALLFVRSEGDHPRIFRVNLDGTGLVQLTNDANYSDESARISPDGSRMLLLRWQFGGNGTGPRLFVARPDATEPVPLTVPTLDGYIFDATWGPGS